MPPPPLKVTDCEVRPASVAAPCEGGGEGQAEEEMTEATFSQEEQAICDSNEKWLLGLERTPAGKTVIEYLSHMEAATRAVESGMGGVECPQDQAVMFRRVLVAALQRKAGPFGLPSPLPKIIAIVSFAGRKMLLTTDNPLLLQLLVHTADNPSGTASTQDAVKTILSFQKSQPEYTILVTYALPFQVEMTQLYWEVRTLLRTPKGHVEDGQLVFNIRDHRVRTTGHTAAQESSASASFIAGQIEAFAQNMHAVDLDAGTTQEDDLVGGLFSPQVDKLQQMVCMLQHDRKRLLHDHREALKATAAKFERAKEAHAEELKKAYAAERESEAVLTTKLATLTEEAKALHGMVATLKGEVDAARRTNAQLELELDADRAKLKSRIAQLENASGHSTKQTSAMQREHDRALKKTEKTHADMMEAMERRLQCAVLAERATKKGAEELLVRMTSLSSAMEGADACREVNEAELSSLKKRNARLRLVIAVACSRHRGLKDVLCQETAKQSEIVATALDAREDAAASRRAAAQASHAALEAHAKALHAQEEAEAMQSRCTRMEDELLAARADIVLGCTANASLVSADDEAGATTVAEASSTKGETAVATANAEVQTCGMSKSDIELGELSAAYVKLQDELALKTKEALELRGEIGRLKQKAGKRTPPPGLLSGGGLDVQQTTATAPPPISSSQVVGPAPTNAISFDPGRDALCDASTEAIVSQVAFGMNTLVDIARESYRHRQAAEEGWSRLHALQAMLGFQQATYHSHMQHVPPQQLYNHAGYENAYHAPSMPAYAPSQ